MKRVKFIVLFILSWWLCYHFGYTLGYAYDNTRDVNDLVGIATGILGMYFFYRAIHV